MTKPQRIQRKRTKGWRMPEGAVCVDRSTRFGNPFPVDCYGQAGAVDKFRRLMTGNMSAREMSESSRSDRWSDSGGISLVSVRGFIKDDLAALRGKDLVCWCRPNQPCHADVLLELANG